MYPRMTRLQWPLLLLAALAGCDSGGPAGPGSGPANAIGGTPGKTTNQIQVNLNMEVNDPQDVAFQVTGAKKTNLLLDDDDDPTLPNFRILPSLKAGTYTIIMAPLPAGYAVTSIGCDITPNGGSEHGQVVALNVAGGSVTLQLADQERDVCTFTVRPPPTELTVTINQAPWQEDPVFGYGYATFDVEFSQPVADFTASDVAIGGPGSVVGVSGSGTSYHVTVEAYDSGVITATIPAGGATDTFGNSNEASTSTDNSVEFFLGQQTECTSDDGNVCTVN